jgi:hypothetical protein
MKGEKTMESEEHDFTIYTVGKPFPQTIEKSNEGAVYQYIIGQHQLLFLFPSIRSHEREAFHAGKSHFGLYVEGDVLTFLGKIEHPNGYGAGIPWQDPMYSWHLVDNEEDRELPPAPEDIPDGVGAFITLFLIDTETGILEDMRPLILSTFFTKALHRALRKQAAGSFDKENFMRQVHQIQQKFPRPEDIVKVRQAHCVGGVQERSSESTSVGEVLEQSKKSTSVRKQVVVTAQVSQEVSEETLRAIYDAYMVWRTNVMPTQPPEEQVFTTKMTGKKIWVMEDAEAVTILYPEDY